MARTGPRKVQRYSLGFKLKAVKLCHLRGVRVPEVAEALAIHPFMLFKWRKEPGEGTLRGRADLPAEVKAPASRDVRRYQALKRAHAALPEEHALLNKAIRFCSARKPTSSRSSSKNGRRSG